MPTCTLARQRSNVGRHFRPACRIGNKADVIVLIFLLQVAMQAHYEVKVLPNRVGTKTTHLFDQVLAEDSEGAGDDWQRVEMLPRFAAEQERTQVFDYLKNLDPTYGKAYLPVYSMFVLSDVLN